MLKCQTVLIKFMDKNLPQQEVRSLQVSGSKGIECQHTDGFLSLIHVTENGNKLKMLNFNLKDVKEYVCDGINNSIPATNVYNTGDGSCVLKGTIHE